MSIKTSLLVLISLIALFSCGTSNKLVDQKELFEFYSEAEVEGLASALQYIDSLTYERYGSKGDDANTCAIKYLESINKTLSAGKRFPIDDADHIKNLSRKMPVSVYSSIWHLNETVAKDSLFVEYFLVPNGRYRDLLFKLGSKMKWAEKFSSDLERMGMIGPIQFASVPTKKYPIDYKNEITRFSIVSFFLMWESNSYLNKNSRLAAQAELETD